MMGPARSILRAIFARIVHLKIKQLERRRALRLIAGGFAAAGAAACVSLGAAPPPPPPPPVFSPPPPPPPPVAQATAIGSTAPVDGGHSSRPANAMPYFGSFPQWSASYAFNRSTRARFLRLAALTEPSLYDVGDRLAEVFLRSGYSDFGFYETGGGFVMVARLEKINDDGTPVEPLRFISPRETQPFGFSGFLGRLLFGEEGHWRVIVMTASDQTITPQGGPPTVSRADAWFSRAAPALPSYFTRMPFTDAHTLTALIYEFRKDAGDDDTAVVPVRRLTSRQHLAGAGVSARLGLA